MEIYQELYKQLNSLVSRVSTCNYIPYEDKKDIIQNTIIQLHKKIEEGKIVDKYEDIKNYSFVTLKNFCNSYHKKTRETPVEEFWELVDDTPTSDQLDHRKFLHRLIRQYIQNSKYDEKQKKVCELLLEDYSDEQISEITTFNKREISKLKFNIKNRLKADVKREIKFIIKNTLNKSIHVPCYTISDVKDYFPNMIQKNVTYMINEGITTQDGFYVDALYKKKRKNG
jgi:DNA-directed RNA polymerase specialized sigma24 family protein